MTAKRHVEPSVVIEAGTDEEARSPRPVEGGTVFYESLGRFVDNLLGDGRIRRRVRDETEPNLIEEEEMPDDPPPAAPPPPVPGGTEETTHGRRPARGV